MSHQLKTNNNSRPFLVNSNMLQYNEFMRISPLNKKGLSGEDKLDFNTLNKNLNLINDMLPHANKYFDTIDEHVENNNKPEFFVHCEFNKTAKKIKLEIIKKINDIKLFNKELSEQNNPDQKLVDISKEYYFALIRFRSISGYIIQTIQDYCMGEGNENKLSNERVHAICQASEQLQGEFAKALPKHFSVFGGAA